MKPEEALEVARASVVEQRATGAYSAPSRELVVSRSERVTSDQLMEWAAIEPDPRMVVSTRRLGKPITWFKRLLVHLMRQHLDQLASQQTRFNVHLLARVVEQEERLAMYEDWLRDSVGEGEPGERGALGERGGLIERGAPGERGGPIEPSELGG